MITRRSLMQAAIGLLSLGSVCKGAPYRPITGPIQKEIDAWLLEVENIRLKSSPDVVLICYHEIQLDCSWELEKEFRSHGVWISHIFCRPHVTVYYRYKNNQHFWHLYTNTGPKSECELSKGRVILL